MCPCLPDFFPLKAKSETKPPEMEEGERAVTAEAQAMLSVFWRDCEYPLVFLPGYNVCLPSHGAESNSCSAMTCTIFAHSDSHTYCFVGFSLFIQLNEKYLGVFKMPG